MADDERPTPDRTGTKQADTQFKPGQSGNPKGRPKGARNKLGEAFLSDFLEDWEENGKEAIKTMRSKRPHEYVKVAASILPKELNVKVSEFDELTDEQLDRRIDALADALRLEVGTGKADGGETKAPSRKSLN
ncbi:MAG: DUF5681 domain-containing protein [Pseudomonadota bacterium]